MVGNKWDVLRTLRQKGGKYNCEQHKEDMQTHCDCLQQHTQKYSVFFAQMIYSDVTLSAPVHVMISVNSGFGMYNQLRFRSGWRHFHM